MKTSLAWRSGDQAGSRTTAVPLSTALAPASRTSSWRAILHLSMLSESGCSYSCEVTLGWRCPPPSRRQRRPVDRSPAAAAPRRGARHLPARLAARHLFAALRLRRRHRHLCGLCPRPPLPVGGRPSAAAAALRLPEQRRRVRARRPDLRVRLHVPDESLPDLRRDRPANPPPHAPPHRRRLCRRWLAVRADRRRGVLPLWRGLAGQRAPQPRRAALARDPRGAAGLCHLHLPDLPLPPLRGPLQPRPAALPREARQPPHPAHAGDRRLESAARTGGREGRGRVWLHGGGRLHRPLLRPPRRDRLAARPRRRAAGEGGELGAPARRLRPGRCQPRQPRARRDLGGLCGGASGSGSSSSLVNMRICPRSPVDGLYVDRCGGVTVFSVLVLCTYAVTYCALSSCTC
mmetsp:Transcript_1644/g.4889  ORF Transcript_1644/g.4889 Transcript_1644/m.4889 type:complete len:404 (-) Transcript_1644:20-1231(-)